jgi:acetone carboxylase gamma subunit
MSEVRTERPTPVLAADELPGIGDAFVLCRDEDGLQYTQCADCGHRYGLAERDPKLGAVMTEGDIADLSRLNSVGMTERLVTRSFYCPSCALLFAVNVQQKGDPIMLEWSIRGTAS